MYKIGLLGYSYSGKSSLFKKVTGKVDEVYDPMKPNVGVGKFKDAFLDKVSVVSGTEKTVYSEFEFYDFKGMSETTGFSDDYLKLLLKTDIIVGFVNNYEDTSEPEKEGNSLVMELVFYDTTRVENLLSSHKGLLPQQIKTLQEGLKLLEEEKFLNNLGEAEKKNLQGLELLTLRPLLIYVNGYKKKYDFNLPNLNQDVLEFEVDTFYTNIIKLLSLITFYTIKGGISQSWLVPEHLNSKEAAGKVHKDIEKGFIRAAVLSFKDFIETGDWSKAKTSGLLKFLGPNSKISDKDIVEFYFH